MKPVQIHFREACSDPFSVKLNKLVALFFSGYKQHLSPRYFTMLGQAGWDKERKNTKRSV